MKLHPHDPDRIVALTLGHYDRRAEDFRDGNSRGWRACGERPTQHLHIRARAPLSAEAAVDRGHPWFRALRVDAWGQRTAAELSEGGGCDGVSSAKCRRTEEPPKMAAPRPMRTVETESLTDDLRPEADTAIAIT